MLHGIGIWMALLYIKSMYFASWVWAINKKKGPYDCAYHHGLLMPT